MKRVLFVCTGNSARSQMAEGLLRALGRGAYEAHSAGTEPKGLNPLAVRVMREISFDISGHRSKPLDGYRGEKFDVVVTVCDRARETCPAFPNAGKTLHWSLEDPAGSRGSEDEKLAVFRRVRDEIRGRIEAFVQSKTKEETT